MTEAKRCVYTQLENGIHEFVITESSRAAVDDMVNFVAAILKTTPDNAPPTCYLIDNSQVDALPINYLRSRVKELDRLRPPNRDPSRLAILYDGMLGSIANTILTVMLKNQLRFFNPKDRDSAMHWILQDE